MTTVAEANAWATNYDRYEFVEVLGRGGFGVVFLAIDKSNGKQVAIKCIKVGSFLSELNSDVSKAMREAKLLMRLRDPYILGFLSKYDYRDASGKNAIAIVTDYCANGDLQHHLKSGNWPNLNERLQWSLQLAHALDYLHKENVAHRDIKPSNILITRQGTLKIADVGLAKPLYEIQSQLGIIDQPFEIYMSSKAGTPTYMAPEVWAQHYNLESDVFSLGLVFVVMAEKPPSIKPLAQWNGKECPLGQMYHHSHLTRSLKASHLLHMQKATALEVKLFDAMLDYNYRERFSAQKVFEEVRTILCDSTIRLQLNPTDPPAEWRGCYGN